MVVAFDNNVLCLLLHPDAEVPNDPTTGKPIERAQDRIELLIEQLARQDARIVIPAPVLSEFLTYASTEYLDEISTSKNFSVGPFDERAAIEAAVALRRAIKSGRGKKLGLDGPWQKIKVDRQIVAIAKVEKAQVIYTTDSHIQALAIESGLEAIHIASLPLPPSRTPLLDAADGTTTASSAHEPQQLSGQSLDGDSSKASPSVPARSSVLQGDPMPRQQGSSPAAPPPPLSKQ